jgi:hypothetical protein
MAMSTSERIWEGVKFLLQLVIALSVVVVGWGLNTRIEAIKQAKTESLEKEKMEEAREQFWLQKRLDALADITGQCSNMSEIFFDYAGKKEVPDKVKEEYANRINQARNAINRHIVILGPDFDKRISPYIYLHRSFRDIGLPLCGDYVEMAGSIENALDGLYQAALEKKELPHLPLKEMKHEDRIKLSPEKYLEEQKKHWTPIKTKAFDGKQVHVKAVVQEVEFCPLKMCKPTSHLAPQFDRIALENKATCRDVLPPRQV